MKAPSYYAHNKEELIARRNYVLDRMQAVGFTGAEEVTRAKADPLVFARQKADIKAPHFVMYVKSYLEGKYGVNYVENAGLRVYTTLDWELQQHAERVVREVGAENEKKYKAKNAALVAVDPQTGQLLAMVGSRDYFDTARDGNFNVTTSQNRQPGSAFKPIVYAAFFKKGFPPDTMLFDAKTEFSTNPEEPYAPKNYDDKFRGPVAAKSALAQSLNVPSVKVLYLTGIDRAIDLAHELGITTLKDKSRVGLSLVLGGGEVSPIDMAYSYGVLAHEGVRSDRAFLLKVEDAGGNVREEWRPRKRAVLDTNVARMISTILSSDELRAPVFGERGSLHFEGFDVAAKTGTTQEYKDAWVAGYTPSLAAVVWVGNNDSTPMERGGAGIAAAGPIFHQFMEEFLKKSGKVERFVPPEPIVSSKPVLDGNYLTEVAIKIDKDSLKRATAFTPPHKTEERIFRELHTVLHYVNKDDPLGDVPSDPFRDPQYLNWEKGIYEWINEHKEFAVLQTSPPAEFDDVHTEANAPQVAVLSPAPHEYLTDPLAVRADVSARFGVRQVSFFFDGILFASDSSFPYEAGLPLSLVAEGSHTLLVRAYDAYDNTGDGEVLVFK